MQAGRQTVRPLNACYDPHVLGVQKICCAILDSVLGARERGIADSWLCVVWAVLSAPVPA